MTKNACDEWAVTLWGWRPPRGDGFPSDDSPSPWVCSRPFRPPASFRWPECPACGSLWTVPVEHCCRRRSVCLSVSSASSRTSLQRQPPWLTPPPSGGSTVGSAAMIFSTASATFWAKNALLTIWRWRWGAGVLDAQCEAVQVAYLWFSRRSSPLEFYLNAESSKRRAERSAGAEQKAELRSRRAEHSSSIIHKSTQVCTNDSAASAGYRLLHCITQLHTTQHTAARRREQYIINNYLSVIVEIPHSCRFLLI